MFDLDEKLHIHRWGNKHHATKDFWKNTKNVEEAIYHTLTENNSRLKSKNRRVVIQTLKRLPYDLGKYLVRIGLGSALSNAFNGNDVGSPLAVIEVFDRVYQQVSGDNKSLFDLDEKDHLHKWGSHFRAPSAYWQDPDNVVEAIYHIMTEANPKLKSKDRREVINGINELSENIHQYFEKLGIKSKTNRGFKSGNTGSQKFILEVFSEGYQQATGDVSLMQRNQKYHLNFDGQNRLIRENAS